MEQRPQSAEGCYGLLCYDLLWFMDLAQETGKGLAAVAQRDTSMKQ